MPVVDGFERNKARLNYPARRREAHRELDLAVAQAVPPKGGSKAVRQMFLDHRDGKITKQELVDQVYRASWKLAVKAVNRRVQRILQGSTGRYRDPVLHPKYWDWLGEVQFTVLQCIDSYDPDLSYQFSTYLTRAIHNFFNGIDKGVHDVRSSSPRNYAQLVRGHTVVGFQQEGDLPDTREPYEESFACRVHEYLKERMRPSQFRLLDERSNGVTLREIGDREGVSKEAIRQRVDRALAEARKILGVTSVESLKVRTKKNRTGYKEKLK